MGRILMKKIIALFLCIFIVTIGLVHQVFAQGVEIDCGDDVIILDGVDIQFPNVDPSAEHTVTAIGIGEFDPILAVFNQQQNGGCNDDSTNASGYSLDLPTTEFVLPNPFNSQTTFSNSNFMRTVIGEFDNLDGEVVLMVEGLTYDGNPDLVNVIVTESMIQSGIPLTAYVIEAVEGLDLSLALVDDNGVPLLDDISEPVTCDDAGDNELCWGAHVPLLESFTNISNTIITDATAISPMLSVPLTADDVQSIVPFQVSYSATAEETLTGDYVFLLHYGVGELDVADGIASASSSPLGTSLSCDDQILVSNAIEVNIPRVDAQYTISLLGQEAVNPMLALMDSGADTGICHVLSSDADTMFAQLPLLEDFNPSAANVRTPIITETARILTGLVDDASGDYLLVIDGLSIPPEGIPDVISVTVTSEMIESGLPVSAFMISDTLDLDPQLALVSADQEILSDSDDLPIVCTQTEDDEACWGTYEDMASAQIALGEDNFTIGISNDVMLQIPLSEELVGTSLNFMSSGVGETFGDYLFILHLPTGATQTTDEE